MKGPCLFGGAAAMPGSSISQFVASLADHLEGAVELKKERSGAWMCSLDQNKTRGTAVGTDLE